MNPRAAINVLCHCLRLLSVTGPQAKDPRQVDLGCRRVRGKGQDGNTDLVSHLFAQVRRGAVGGSNNGDSVVIENKVEHGIGDAAPRRTAFVADGKFQLEAAWQRILCRVLQRHPRRANDGLSVGLLWAVERRQDSNMDDRASKIVGGFSSRPCIAHAG